SPAAPDVSVHAMTLLIKSGEAGLNKQPDDTAFRTLRQRYAWFGAAGKSVIWRLHAGPAASLESCAALINLAVEAPLEAEVQEEITVVLSRDGQIARWWGDPREATAFVNQTLPSNWEVIQ